MAGPVRLRVADGPSRAHANHDQKGGADLVLRMARENENGQGERKLGCKRIHGQLSNEGYRIGKNSDANILQANGIEPARLRRQTPSWATFFHSHWDVL